MNFLRMSNTTMPPAVQIMPLSLYTILFVLNTLGVSDYSDNIVNGSNVSLFASVNGLLTLAKGCR